MDTQVMAAFMTTNLGEWTAPYLSQKYTRPIAHKVP